MQNVEPLLPCSPGTLSGFAVIFLLVHLLELIVNNAEQFHAFLVENEDINNFRPFINKVQRILNVFYTQQGILLDLSL